MLSTQVLTLWSVAGAVGATGKRRDIESEGDSRVGVWWVVLLCLEEEEEAEDPLDVSMVVSLAGSCHVRRMTGREGTAGNCAMLGGWR